MSRFSSGVVMRGAARVSERTVQAQVKQLLTAVGGRVCTIGTTRRHGDYQGTMQTAGVPDLYAFLPAPKLHAAAGPTTLWVEVKAPGGRVRPEQATFALRCRDVGQAHVVGGVDELVRWLADNGYIRTSDVAWYREPRAREARA